jgi:carbamoyl-phosphate synthase large subunit
VGKRTDIKSILIIGSGPIVIGQACEFDYSGAQACKALRDEGYKVILINSNPATIMTDPHMADVTYIEPITWQMVEKIIEKERPDALLPTMGGQTALNCALDLAKHGVLEKYNVEMIGATKEAIDKAEDREKFKKAMTKIGLHSARSAIAHSLEEALQVQAAIGFPAIIRPSFTMGGSGGGIAYSRTRLGAIGSCGHLACRPIAARRTGPRPQKQAAPDRHGQLGRLRLLPPGPAKPPLAHGACRHCHRASGHAQQPARARLYGQADHA